VHEYFFAREVALHQPMEFVLQHVSDPEWAEVLVFVCGLIEDATEVIKQVMQTDPYLATRYTIYAKGISAEVIDELVLILIKRIMSKSKSPQPWLYKRYQEMSTILAIQTKTKKDFSNLYYHVYKRKNAAVEAIANFYLEMDMTENAIKFLTPLVDQDNTNVKLRGLLARALMQLGRPEDSLQHLGKCLEINPHDAWN